MIDWNTYFSSLRKYLDYYRQRDQMPAMRGFSTLSLPMTTSATVAGAGQVLMSEQELAGLVSLTQLITSIVVKDQEARRLTYENRHWNCVESCVGLLACSIPLVLKGYLYKFLAALSIDEAAAIHVWNCMLCEKLSVLLPDGKLAGVQQDLEDQECVLKAYDCSEGYLHLLRELFTHKTRPAAKQLEPHLQFIVKSVLCHYSQRSYSDVRQMWELVKLGFDCLYELLRLFYVTQAGVAARTSEVQLLAQLLNHTPLFKTLVQVLLECQTPLLGEGSASDNNVVQDADGAQLAGKKQEAAFSATRLLYMALSNRSAISDAIRSTGSTLMVASLESLLFWPVAGRSSSQVPQQPTTCLSLLASFISDSDSSAGQTFYVLKILRVASAHRPSIQTRLVQSLYGQRQSLVHAAAALSSIQHSEVEVSQFDLVPLDVEKCRPARLRGELIRHLFETLIDAMESDGSNANIAYLLLGFNLRNIANSQFTFTTGGGGDEDHPSFTALHNVLEMALELATSDQPFSSPHSALFEPALRLLLRLSAYHSASSTLMLRHMRSYDELGLVYRLATSPLFLRSDGFADGQRRLKLDKDAEYGMMVATRSVQAVILELTALELAALLRQGHVESPKAFVIALLSTPSSELDAVHEDSTALSELGTSRCDDAKALLWSLLDQSRLDIEELAVPECQKFDAQKIDEMLRHCVLRTSCNVDQYDVEYVHLLLNTEISSIINAEIATIKEESELILRYCARRNAQNLLQAACVHVLSGWLSVVNVLALHAPVAFIEHELHYTIMLDALFLLKNYCLSVETGVELSAMLSGCVFRVVRAMCSLLREMLPTPDEMKEALFPTLHLLLQCLVLPGYNKSVRFKMDLYGSILSVFESFNPPPQPTISMGGGFPQPPMPNLSRMTERERNKDSAWSRIFPAMTSEVVATISSDISYAPMSLKVVAASALSELVREDRYRGQNIAKELVNSGAIRCVLDANERSMEGSKLKPQIQRIREDVDKLLS